jgi:F-type H+-transporting ATPase subunit b
MSRSTGSLKAGLAVALTAMVLPAAAHAEGMPQLDFANPLTTSQVVWMAIIFLALYILVARWGLPRVASVLEERAASIAADLDAAHAAKARSDAAAAELTETARRARAEAQGAINEAVGKAKAEAAERAAEANHRLEAQLAAAERRIAEARTIAMRALGQVAADTATGVVVRLTGQTPEPAAVTAAVAQALAQRG